MGGSARGASRRRRSITASDPRARRKRKRSARDERKTRRRPCNAGLDGAKPSSPAAGARARGALSALDRPRAGDRRRRDRDRPSRRRSGRDRALPPDARLGRGGSRRHGSFDRARGHHDRKAFARRREGRPRRLLPVARGWPSSTIRPTPTRVLRAPACGRFSPASTRRDSTPKGSRGSPAARRKRTRRLRASPPRLEARARRRARSTPTPCFRSRSPSSSACSPAASPPREGATRSRIGLEKIEALALRLTAAAALGEAFNANVGGVLARLSAERGTELRAGAA